ncbi:PaaI family thioesterase [Sulfitobacter sp. F26169L]|uniref:PaaI family thioesterase n=1 Tax=Sulfitobacter sp. F26169L TaxID=2996015 RepID=UPI002260E30D|nr:PaaI family thioesterase [Sulfitobacter sp. F26169L]MCX7567585.1 PaaI family thioesterase [Sulfitobacter sp. F26169L]
MDQTSIDRIKQSFAAQTMMATLGAQLARVEQGLVRITAPILPCAKQQQGLGHGGLTFSIGDVACGLAALSMMPLDQEVVTAEIKINMLAPAQGDLLIATGKVAKAGRRLSVVTAEVHAETASNRTLIAILQGTMVPVPR